MVRIVNCFPRFFAAHAAATALFILSLAICASGAAQNTPPPSAEKSPAKPSSASQERPAEKIRPRIPAQIALLETHVRFEANGDSRKEIHALVKINDEAGARQFARLNFTYNRAFQSLEIPLARITHANGGTLDVLASAITDNPDPAVVNFPAYQDIRVKSIRILGLEPDDTFEYRVVTTTTHHPLAPDFWFEHTFDRSGVVSHEVVDLDVPVFLLIHPESLEKLPTPHINPASAATSIRTTGDGNSARTVYHWDRTDSALRDASLSTDTTQPDVSYSSFREWLWLSIRLDEKLLPGSVRIDSLHTYEAETKELSRVPETAPEVKAKAEELTRGSASGKAKLQAFYDFVSRKIATVDLPLGATGFAVRPAKDTLASGYATQEDKFVLFAAMAATIKLSAEAALTGYCDEKGRQLARPSVFKRLLISAYDGAKSYWLDPSLEVAPFAMIPPNSGDCAFILNRGFYSLNSTGHEWTKLDPPLPFPSKQRVTIDATVAADGTLSTHAKYVMRGENELLLRVAFHQSPREKWDGVAQLLALSDGFRGKVTKTVASDPYETHDPFTVSYDITQPKFLDWSKKPLRVPALLPLLGLPDPPAKSTPGAPAPPIELGTPLDVEVTATLHLPEGTGAEVPAGTSVERDFATYNSHYSVSSGTLTAYRHINFILKQIPADRAAEYNAFLHTVQNDESQFFTLERAVAPLASSSKP